MFKLGFNLSSGVFYHISVKPANTIKVLSYENFHLNIDSTLKGIDNFTYFNERHFWHYV